MSGTESKYLMNDDSFATRALHVGSEPERWKNGEMVPPISLSTNYKQAIPPHHKGYVYTRFDNPVRGSLQACLASLEETSHCLVTPSGMAAASLILQLVEYGDHIVAQSNVYHGVFNIWKDITSKIATVDYVDGTDLKVVEKLIRPNTKIVWCESPTNPLMKVVDIKELCKVVRKLSSTAIIVCDSTFMSPYFQRPATLGVDIVMHSCSKYIGGHSDILMGAICTNRDDLHTKLRKFQIGLGPVACPFDCYLALRSLKTLEVRMQKHMSNALAVAKFLESHPMIEKVFHPGLPSHPQYEIAKRQTFGHSGMFSVYVKNHDLATTTKILESLRVFQVADSLGGCESIIKMPSQMPPGALTPDEMKEQGITDGLLRFSIGLEGEQDLVKDLEQALNHVQKLNDCISTLNEI